MAPWPGPGQPGTDLPSGARLQPALDSVPPPWLHPLGVRTGPDIPGDCMLSAALHQDASPHMFRASCAHAQGAEARWWHRSKADHSPVHMATTGWQISAAPPPVPPCPRSPAFQWELRWGAEKKKQASQKTSFH